MFNDDEARTGYNELLQKLRAIGADNLVSEILQAVSTGRVRLREREHVQERLPTTSALEMALRILAAWTEPVFLVSEARTLINHASGTTIGGLRWDFDRLEFVEAEAGVDVPAMRNQAIQDIPPLDGSAGEVRRYLERLNAIAQELRDSGEA